MYKRKTKHHLIIVPGLGGTNMGLKYISSLWDKFGLTTHIVDIAWRNKEISFTPKRNRILNLIDSFPLSDKVSLLGTSAGGSAALNVYCKRKNRIYKVINVCGRLRKGKGVNPTLDIASITSKSFKDSVLMCEENEKKFNNIDRLKFMTIRSFFDETVPVSTMTINGAKNVKIFSISHVMSIVLAMTLYSKIIKTFLKS